MDSIDEGNAGIDFQMLSNAKRWFERHMGREQYRIIIVCGGRIVGKWGCGFGSAKHNAIKTSIKDRLLQALGKNLEAFSKDRNETERHLKLPLASVSKSIFSCILGIAIQEGKIPSTNAKIIDYYPEAMDVVEGEGPKPGRFASEKDQGITFGQLISNTSGYLKPGEEPGKVFHYQTYGMNILAHAIARAYGIKHSSDEESLPGIHKLIDEKMRIPIDASWSYKVTNFKLDPKARVDIFGNFCNVYASIMDVAKLGLLWCNYGRWMDRQVIPEGWMREATRTALDIVANCPEKEWKYGYGFWTNDRAQLWPGLPRDAFAASGAGGQHIWVCPSAELVVTQSPGIVKNRTEKTSLLLNQIFNACHSG